MTTTAPITVTGVDFVTLWTKDLARSLEFYESVLGLECVARYREDGAEVQAGNLTLQLMDHARLGLPFDTNGPIALRVDDVAAARTALEAHGVEFVAAFDSGVCHQAIFHDPDGNSLVLHHRYAPR